MATPMANRNPIPPSSKPWSYSELFNAAGITQAEKIMAATSRLAIALNHVIPSLALDIWAENFENFQPETLAQAFSTAEKTLEAWPTPAKVMSLIFDVEFIADYTWLLCHLKRHGVEWKDASAVYGPWTRNEAPGPLPPELRQVRKELEPPRAAPDMPTRLKRALEILAAGTWQDGLAILSNRPAISGDIGIQQARRGFDRDVRTAWQMARNEEMPS